MMGEKMDRHRRRHSAFYLAFAVGIIVVLCSLLVLPEKAALLGAIAFFTAYLVIAWSIVPRLSAVYLKRNGDETDLPSLIIFAVTLGTVITALVALFVLLNSKQSATRGEIFMGLSSVVLGWLTVHTMAALHYAHLHWVRDTDEDTQDRAVRRKGGLEFPGTEKPQGWDFLYFSFVIGMTAQTSDVAIRTTEIRRFNLAHSVVSFFFNTVLVAAAVNLALSLSL